MWRTRNFKDEELKSLLSEFIYALERGDVRAAERTQSEWRSNRWVKQGILSLFKHCKNSEKGKNGDQMMYCQSEAQRIL
ncbi:MAG: hypothetical protein J07AB43_10850 [Candidatus Nanosalina sp. J07AB43]|nr:MAG: hypothetical protein J07AB43_10850 [Candidatus Nanosalina sp. J07AB43]